MGYLQFSSLPETKGRDVVFALHGDKGNCYDFEQREYTDYAEIERQLLLKSVASYESGEGGRHAGNNVYSLRPQVIPAGIV